jgi:hypothetical protein
VQIPTPSRLLAFAIVASLNSTAQADPLVTSWYTAHSAKYARIYQTTAAQSSQTSSTTWSRGAGTQSLPTYSGVSEVLYSASWVYIRTTGLASHLMGPWYLDAAKQMLFPNYPGNTATIFRFPRTTSVASPKTNTGNGAIGYFVNGVAFFDNRDAFSYLNAHGFDATPMNQAMYGSGDGIWNRDAYQNEQVTFDAALAHQAGKQYHYHVQPIALRYQLGDHVDYNSSTNAYTENSTAVSAHSPIIAWAIDGYPVYGPYGYATPTDATSGVRRMVSGYVLRNGQYGTTNLNTANRQTLPTWAAVAQNRSTTLSSNQYGPTISTTYPLNHYLEDWDYLGDLGYVQGSNNNPGGVFFDLDRYNGRFCVTPEYPGGTYAYFCTLNADNSPAFPYNIGRQFYGSPTGGSVASIGETVTTAFHGGPNKTETWNSIVRDSNTGYVTLTWSAVEGGSYEVDQTSNLTNSTNWTALTPNVTASSDSAQKIDNSLTTNDTTRDYKGSRTSLANFDSTGFDYP